MARNVVGHHTEREFQNVDMTENSAARDGPLGRKNADHTVCKTRDEGGLLVRRREAHLL